MIKCTDPRDAALVESTATIVNGWMATASPDNPDLEMMLRVFDAALSGSGSAVMRALPMGSASSDGAADVLYAVRCMIVQWMDEGAR